MNSRSGSNGAFRCCHACASVRPASNGTATLGGRAAGSPLPTNDELLERRLWVLCPTRASMVRGREPGKSWQRSPRDGGEPVCADSPPDRIACEAEDRPGYAADGAPGCQVVRLSVGLSGRQKYVGTSPTSPTSPLHGPVPPAPGYLTLTLARPSRAASHLCRLPTHRTTPTPAKTSAVRCSLRRHVCHK